MIVKNGVTVTIKSSDADVTGKRVSVGSTIAEDVVIDVDRVEVVVVVGVVDEIIKNLDWLLSKNGDLEKGGNWGWGFTVWEFWIDSDRCRQGRS